jgi:hypothetical protein
VEHPQLTRARRRHTRVEKLMQAVFSVDPLRGYMTRPNVFGSANECIAVEGSVVER